MLAIVALSVSAASGQTPERPVVVHRLFQDDVEGGHYQIAEDPEINGRFRSGKTVAAELRLIKPYRTKDYGSAVGLMFPDARGVVQAQVVLIDGPDDTKFFLSVRKSKAAGKLDTSVLGKQITIPKSAVARMTVRAVAPNKVLIAVDGQTIDLQLDFPPERVWANIYCAQGWVKFLDGDIIA